MKRGFVFQIGSRLLDLSAFDPKRHSALAMLSFPHLVVLFVIALVIFGPQKLPELARMLGKATAEFRKMTNDFRYALEDEVREIERQTRIREEEAAAAARAAQAPVPAPTPAAAPEGAVPRESPAAAALPESSAPQAESQPESQNEAGLSPQADSASSQPAHAEPVSLPHEKSSDDNAAV
jgi:TatA/E family protein of Tat protein translocase